MQSYVFISVESLPRSVIVGSCGNSMFCAYSFSNGCIFLQSRQQCVRFLISSHLHQHLLLFDFFIIATLVSVRQYLMILMCISLMTNKFEHLFTSLLTICLSCLKKCLFKSIAHSLIGLLVFIILLSYKSALYILDISPLSDKVLMIFSSILWVVISFP